MNDFRVELSPDNKAHVLCSGIQTYPEISQQFENIFNYVAGESQSDIYRVSRIAPLIEAVACQNDEAALQSYIVGSYDGFYYGFAGILLRRISQLDWSGKLLYNWLVKMPYRPAGIQESAIFAEFVNAMVMDWSTQELLDAVSNIFIKILSSLSITLFIYSLMPFNGKPYLRIKQL